MSFKLMSAIIPTSSTIINRNEDSNKLLNQLLECVQQCQKRFGGKTELATEFDSCVAGLCLTLEAVFCHGLRNKPQDAETSTIKQVTEIVTNSLHFNNDNPSFWYFIRQHLTKHEQDRFNVLKHIWTDLGKSKAWIRASLNERSLERYINVALSNKEFLKMYYEDWALLRDDEKNSLLPNMAAGLGSILFAIKIDNPDHNSGLLAQKLDKMKIKTEPIIEAPVVERKKEQKRKRKVATQVISFDDDDSVLSSSIPSSSGSTLSDNSNESTASIKSNDSKNCVEKLQNIPQANIQDQVTDNTTKLTKERPIRKLSIENSGSRDKYPNKIDGPLTPMQSDIGELTPVFIETNNEVSNSDILEVPTDISAVLSVVEAKNNEEIKKLNDKIVTVTKENESLKEQLKKYIEALQMLNKDDVIMQKELENLEIDAKSHNYKHEAKIFEKKLVQVAEMHAELMDFNVLLQQNLCTKDAIIDKLKLELEELRGPILNEELQDNLRPCINVWIPSAFLTGTGSDAHHVYQIYVKAGNDEWNIYRRYAQFYALHSDLKKLDHSISAFDFPPKKSIGKKDAALVEDRRKRLQKYLRRVLNHWPNLSQCNSRYLLEQHLIFFKDQKDDGKFKKKQSGKNIPGASSDNHYTGL